MKGHVRQRSKGSWEVTIDVGADPATGRRVRHFETVRGNKRDAQLRLAELLTSMQTGTYVKPKQLTVGEWLGEWVKSYVKTHCAPRTVESYESEIRRQIVPKLGRVQLIQLQPYHLQDYYNQALADGRTDGKGGLSNRTVQYHHRIISEALSHAIKMGLLYRNVADAVDPPRPDRRRMATMAVEHVPRFLEAAQETPYYAVFYTALFTGMRLGELLGLRWDDVDLDMCSLSVVQALYKRCGICNMIEPKTPHSRRRIALSPSLATTLRQHRAKQEAERVLVGKALTGAELVFSYPDGRPLDPGTVTHTFARTLSKAGLAHLRFHDLRHTHATLMLKAGVHPKIVQERLGHGSIAVTLDIYSHAVSGIQEAAAQRFDETLGVGVPSMLRDATPPRDVGKMSAKGVEVEREPPGTRTLNLLIKSQLLYQLS